jgi:hypothetical protein
MLAGKRMSRLTMSDVIAPSSPIPGVLLAGPLPFPLLLTPKPLWSDPGEAVSGAKEVKRRHRPPTKDERHRISQYGRKASLERLPGERERLSKNCHQLALVWL